MWFPIVMTVAITMLLTFTACVVIAFLVVNHSGLREGPVVELGFGQGGRKRVPEDQVELVQAVSSMPVLVANADGEAFNFDDALALGVACLMDKPIVMITIPGHCSSDKCIALADRIVEYGEDMNERVRATVDELIGEGSEDF